MERLKQIPSHSPLVVTRKTGNEYILVPVSSNIADMDTIYTLNETGAFIWELIDGKMTVEEIIGEVIKEFDTDRKTATRDVFDFINSMEKYLIIKV
ncbi:MAG: PqqD family protein [Bacteroidales bacterium]